MTEISITKEECDVLVEKIQNSIQCIEDESKQTGYLKLLVREFIHLLQKYAWNDEICNVLKLFSFYVSSQKAHLYNIGYFLDKIDSFAKDWNNAHERLYFIVRHILSLEKVNGGLLIKKKICYDDVFSFEINEEGIQKVQFDIHSFFYIFQKGKHFSIRISDMEENKYVFLRNYEMKFDNNVDIHSVLTDYQNIQVHLKTFKKMGIAEKENKKTDS